MLDRPRYEVFPLDGVAEQVTDLLPLDTKLTITASARRGLEPTLELAGQLATLGYPVVPHLSARLIADRAQLKEVLDRLAGFEITEAFVIGGDCERPLGEFCDATALLRAMSEVGHGLTEIGVAGYPEPHPKIDDDLTIQAMWDKREHATYVVSQMCFDAVAIARWLERVRHRGIELPVHIGVPGPASVDRLLRISRRIGVAESARFLTAHGAGMFRLGRPGRYTPDRLLNRLLNLASDHISGLHLYTFNDVRSAEQWRQSKLAQGEP